MSNNLRHTNNGLENCHHSTSLEASHQVHHNAKKGKGEQGPTALCANCLIKHQGHALRTLEQKPQPMTKMGGQ